MLANIFTILMQLLRLILCLPFLISCQSNEGKATSIINNGGADTTSITKSYKSSALFDNNKPFEIVNASRGITKSSSAADTNMCKGWTLTAMQAAQIMKDAEPIDGTRWDLEFLVLPCIVKGQVRQSNKSFDYEINAGSWVRITMADTTQYYGSYKKGNEKYFLEKADEAK